VLLQVVGPTLKLGTSVLTGRRVPLPGLSVAAELITCVIGAISGLVATETEGNI
jgi:hypothetical protein